MNNGAPRTKRCYGVCHKNGMLYLSSLGDTELLAKSKFCDYWASLASGEGRRDWRYYQGQGFRVVPVVVQYAPEV